MKIGIGYDVHRFIDGRKCIIGGVDIPNDRGIDAHSDGDVLIHALMDSILGALGEGDIGIHFPESDKNLKDISSIKLLKKVYQIMLHKNFKIGNIDCVVICEKPKIANYAKEMKLKIGDALNTSTDNINIKGTTEEKMGFTGMGKGIKAEVVTLLLEDNNEDI